MLSYFRSSIASSRTPIRLRWTWVWSNGGTIQTGKTRKTRRKACPSATLSTTDITTTNLELKPGLTVWRRRFTAWAMARPVECVWNVMAHAQKPVFLFRRNGRIHLNGRGRQFSWLLEAEVCASALLMLDTPHSEAVSEYWLPTPFAIFPFTSPPVRHRVPSGFKRALPIVQKEWVPQSVWMLSKTVLRSITAHCHQSNPDSSIVHSVI